MLEIGLLGPLEARDGERDLTPRRQKQRALLAVLALRVGQPISSDRLVEELWGERPPRTARHALENYVSELRKTLGPDLIATRPAGYVLELDPVQVDAARFERLVATTRPRSTAECADELREALSLVRGQPLADLGYEPFAQSETPRLLELELHARERLAECDLELGRHADALLALEPLVAQHPLRERLRALFMLALYRSGRQAEALTAYQEIRTTLLEELGIDPGDDLRELERAILRQDPELRPPAAVPSRDADRAEAERVPTPSPHPARKTVSIVAVELVNSRGLAERLDPEPLRAIVDRYLDSVRTAMERHGGVCSRLAGDTVLAVFGIPAAHEDDALRAVRAALDMREAVGVLNDGLLPEHGTFLEVRAAVNTGEALVGTTPEDLATGRAVTIAVALASGARSGQIIVGADAHRLVKDVVEAEPPEASPPEGEPVGFRLVELRPDVHGRILRLDSPLVGRRRQLAALSTAFESTVADRTCHLFTVLGAAGVGKSRLVHEFLDGVGDVALVLRGRCLPYGEGIAYLPLEEAMRLTSRPKPGRAMTPEYVNHRLGELARGRPLVVVFDDAQWADDRLLDLLEGIVESSHGSAVLLLCLARPELLDARPAWGGRRANVTQLLLGPLSEAEAERLVDNLLGESDLADPVRDYVLDSAHGNPLFVEELLAALVDHDVLRRESGRWTTTELPAIPLPPTIQALVAARIDRLPGEERVALELASVEGTRFHRDVVIELAPADLRSDVDIHLSALVRKEIVRPRPGEELFSIRHQVIRDTAYGSMPMRLRAELHDRLARWLESGPGDDELARYHLEIAERYRGELGGRRPV